MHPQAGAGLQVSNSLVNTQANIAGCNAGGGETLSQVLETALGQAPEPIYFSDCRPDLNGQDFEIVAQRSTWL